MTKAKDGGPAFPVENDAGKEYNYIEKGMSLRDWFAGQALAFLFSSRNPSTPHFKPEDDARYCYAVADAMLAERGKR